jgi:glycosyltransferase involved in cell wall biosynthesis
MKTLMAYTDWNHTEKRRKANGYGGIGYYRIIKPSEHIENVKVVGRELSCYGDTLEDQWDNIFKEYDVFWTSYFADDRVAGAMFYHAKKHGKKVVIDIDDNYLDVPESNKLYERFKTGKKERAFLSTILSFADAIAVSTVPLKERLDRHFKERHGLEKQFIMVPNMNDVNDWDVTPANTLKDRFIIGYSGSNSHQDDFSMVVPAIGEIMRKHKHVYFEAMGLLSMDDLIKYLKGWDDDMLMRTALVGATSLVLAAFFNSSIVATRFSTPRLANFDSISLLNSVSCSGVRKFKPPLNDFSSSAKTSFKFSIILI